MQATYTPNNVINFTLKSRQKSCSTLAHWKKYYRRYIIVAGSLKSRGKITEVEYNRYFWYGIPPVLQQILETKLLAKNPGRDMSTPYPAEDVSQIAEIHFQRDNFSCMLWGADQFGVDTMDDSLDEESESDSSEDDDYESD